MSLLPKPPQPNWELLACRNHFLGNETRIDNLYAINQNLQIATGTISLLISLFVIPKIININAYLPAVIVACNVVFALSILEFGVMTSINMYKPDSITLEQYAINFNIVIYLLFLSSGPNVFISFTYLYQSLKMMYPSKASKAMIVCYALLTTWYVTDLLL